MSKILSAIRRNCLECSGGVSKEVALCVIPNCPLYPYRFGGDKRIEKFGKQLINEEKQKRHSKV